MELTTSRAGRVGARPPKRILIINCYFPELREPIRRVNEVPNSLAPVLLAGHFDDSRCEVRLYNEVNSGFIEVFAPKLLEWPDMIVMTSLTAAFDRLLHVTAYARSRNPAVIVAAGGHAVRALPKYSAQFFDYACLGDVEEIREVIREALGADCLASEFRPRYDLAYWIRSLGYVESSRNCNFRCSFCSLTAAGRPYQVQDLAYLTRQLDAMGRRRICIFEDNQLFGDGDRTIRARLEAVGARRAAGQFGHWSGFVTQNFFWEQDNIALARKTGCISLFVGVESFDDNAWLSKINKRQNSRHSQVELIRRCLEGGILFQYGLVFDPTERTVAQMHRELDVICANEQIPGPNFIFLAVPFPGTPMFNEHLHNRRILPNTKMRDLEGSTLSLEPLDPVEDVVDFIRRGKNFRDRRRRYVAHELRFLRRYRKSLSLDQKILSALTVAAIMMPGAFASPGAIFRRKQRRTHVSTTDRLDCVYSPRLPVAERYRGWFEPTRITDERGALDVKLEPDLAEQRPKRAVPEASAQEKNARAG